MSTTTRSPGDEPEKPVRRWVVLNAQGVGDEVVSLDELLSTAAVADGGRSRFLEWVETVTRKGWDHTLRASFLLAVVTGLVGAVLWAVAGAVPSVCTTAVLIMFGKLVSRAPRLA